MLLAEIFFSLSLQIRIKTLNEEFQYWKLLTVRCLYIHKWDKHSLTMATLRDDLSWTYIHKYHWLGSKKKKTICRRKPCSTCHQTLKLPVTDTVFHSNSHSKEGFWFLKLKTKWLSWLESLYFKGTFILIQWHVMNFAWGTALGVRNYISSSEGDNDTYVCTKHIICFI